MLNTQKLLYILPDVAYVAELLPTKKAHTFSIHSFRQINGEFMTEDDDFKTENIQKLFSKLEADTYHLVLPDFLFTNTIVEVKETQESKIKSYLKDELLPNLDLSRESHEIETFVLTQYNGVSKVQLTAIEKTVLAPISQASEASKVQIAHISPLTWTIKSVISLEPSISVIQIGTMLYVAEHYIGVDQCTMAAVGEIENVGETIKTLKGSQPSIQTIYLMTNDLVEDKLKELVSNTLPVQQLASGESSDEQLPNYVKNIIESGMKTLDISDYPVPKFALPKVDSLPAVTPLPTVDTESEAEPGIKKTESTSDTLDVDDDIEQEEELPKPTPMIKDAVSDAEEDLVDQEKEDELLSLTPPQPVFAMPKTVESPMIVAAETSPVVPTIATLSLDDEEDDSLVTSQPEHANVSPVISFSKENDPIPTSDSGHSFIPPTTTFTPPVTSAVSDTPTTSTILEMSKTSPETNRTIIKNKGAKSTARMFLIMLGVFLITVVAGIGVGLAILRMSEGDQAAQNPVPSPSASPIAVVITTPSPVASASASPSANLRQGKRLLVVNATTKAGYAGTIKSKLEQAGFTTVRSANAKGDYEPGNYILMKTEDPALADLLSGDTDLDLSFSDEVAVEDATSQYDAVLVLAE